MIELGVSQPWKLFSKSKICVKIKFVGSSTTWRVHRVYSKSPELQAHLLHEHLLELEQGLLAHQWDCDSRQPVHHLPDPLHVQVADVQCSGKFSIAKNKSVFVIWKTKHFF